MRYAILADIHGNLEALHALSEALRREAIDRYCVIGDVVGYGADPSACLAAVRAWDPALVAGNHEWAVVGKLDAGWLNASARAAIQWTRGQLSVADLAWLRTWPLTVEAAPLTLAHGTLARPERFAYLVDSAQALETGMACPTPICCVGPTHRPLVIVVDTRRRLVRDVVADSDRLAELSVAPAPDMVHVLNPGSVGQPRDGDCRASAMVYDAGTHALRTLRVAYDIASAQRKIRKAGLPTFLAERLAIGW